MSARRIYTPDGKHSMVLWLFRILLVLSYVPLMLCVGLWTLLSEWWSGLQYAWLELRSNHASFKRLWNGETK